MTLLWLRVVLLVGVSACALTNKSKPLDIQYFAPQSPPATADAEPTATAPTGVRLRLRRVNSGSHLRSRIAYRTSPVEVGFYETQRWTEPPEDFVRRSLEHALYERGVLATGGHVVELEVEVEAFEEQRVPRAGHVRLRYRLVDRRDVIAEDTVDVVQPAGREFPAMVVAIGAALDEASAQLTSDVVERLQSR